MDARTRRNAEVLMRREQAARIARERLQSGLITQQGNTNTYSSRYEGTQLPPITNIAPRINNNLPVIMPHVNNLPVMEPRVNNNPPVIQPAVTGFQNSSLASHAPHAPHAPQDNSQGNNSLASRAPQESNQGNSNYTENNQDRTNN